MRIAQSSCTCLAVAVALSLTLPLTASAQDSIRARASRISIGGRIHMQYAQSSVPDAINDFFVRRARITMEMVINDFLDGKIEPDFAGGQAQLQDTYFRLTFAPEARLAFGIFKRSFSTFDISSSTDLPIIERTGVIEGLDVCPGVGGICSLSGITEGLDLDGRDLGLRLEGARGRLGYQATFTNGPGANVPDQNDHKSFSARVGWRVTDGILVSGFGAAHDALLEDDETRYFGAGGVDLEIGTWREGVHVLAAFVVGDNWLADDFPQFLTTQMLASWYVPLGGTRLAGVEPHLRLGWGDGDRSTADDAGMVVTPGLMLYVFGRNAIATDLDIYRPQVGDSEYSFKVQTFLYF